MKHEFDVVEVEPVTLAVTEAVVKPTDIPTLITGMFDIVYAWLQKSEVDQTGHNYALYRNAADGLHMQIGFPVSGRFADSESVRCLQLAGGKTVHTTHHGEYGGLPAAHAQLHEWCEEQSHKPAGISWEVYDDWNDDPAKLETDIYIRLK